MSNSKYIHTTDFKTEINFFPSVGNWAHVAAVATADTPSRYTLYLNNETKDEWKKTSHHTYRARTTSVNYTYAALGRCDVCSGGLGSNYFDGALRDVRMYAHALSKEEIEALYQA